MVRLVKNFNWRRNKKAWRIPHQVWLGATLCTTHVHRILVTFTSVFLPYKSAASSHFSFSSLVSTNQRQVKYHNDHSTHDEKLKRDESADTVKFQGYITNVITSKIVKFYLL